MRRTIVFGLVIWIVIGCTTAKATRVQIPQAGHQVGFRNVARVLIAGFVTPGAKPLDANEETARFLRTQLRLKAGLAVIETEPLQLPPISDPTADVRRKDAVDVFSEVGFWKRLGEEYAEPLILSGTVAFKEVGPRFEERTIGRRTMRLWRRGFSLNLRLVLIDGHTGEVIDSAVMRQRVAYATTGRESALSLYFKLMDEAMPFVLHALGRDVSTTRVLLY